MEIPKVLCIYFEEYYVFLLLKTLYGFKNAAFAF